MLPYGFRAVGATDNCEYAAVCSEDGLFFGVQFHPEVTHTPQGAALIEAFARACGCEAKWRMDAFLDDEIRKIREAVGPTAHAVGGVSGGVDSTVGAALMHRALGARFHAFMIDTGLLRLHEAAEVKARLEAEIPAVAGADGAMEPFKLHVVDASEDFFRELGRSRA